MKPIMYLFRGMPGSGKSTLINKHKLKSNTISLDGFRELFSGLSLTEDGMYGIDQKYNSHIIHFYEEALTTRMREQGMIIIDNLNLKRKDFKNTVNKAISYGYDVKIVNFELENIDFYIERNKGREERKRLPLSSIERLYESFSKINVEDFGMEVISINDFEYDLSKKTKDFIVDLSNYKKIHCIGSIQGCYDTFKELISSYKEDEFYIFFGNYFLGGGQHKEIKDFITINKEKNNFIFLEGKEDKNFVFNNQDIEKNKEEYIDCYKSFKPFFIYTFKDKNIFCSHSGLSCIPTDIRLLNKNTFTDGFGRTDTDVDSIFLNNHKDDEWTQIYSSRGRYFSKENKSISLNRNILDSGKLVLLSFSKDKSTSSFSNNNSSYVKKEKTLFNNSIPLICLDKVLSLNKSKKLKYYSIYSDNIFDYFVSNENKEILFASKKDSFFEYSKIKYKKIYASYSKKAHKIIFVNKKGDFVTNNNYIIDDKYETLMKNESVVFSCLLDAEDNLFFIDGVRLDFKLSKVNKKIFDKKIKTIKFHSKKENDKFLKVMKKNKSELFEI